VISVSRYVESSNGVDLYPGVNFSLTPGEGYFVRMSANVNYIVVGSHNPSQSVPLNSAGVGSFNGTNFVAYPYHSTSANAQGFMNEIGSTSVISVSRYVESSNGVDLYPGVNFTLVPGEAYFVRMSSDVLGWLPAHY
jgi:hypothetical protein